MHAWKQYKNDKLKKNASLDVGRCTILDRLIKTKENSASGHDHYWSWNGPLNQWHAEGVTQEEDKLLLSVERTVHEHILLKALELLAFDFYSNGDLCTPQPAISARLALFSRLKNKTFEELFWLHECLSVMNELRLVDLTFKAWVEKAFQKHIEEESKKHKGPILKIDFMKHGVLIPSHESLEELHKAGDRLTRLWKEIRSRPNPVKQIISSYRIHNAKEFEIKFLEQYYAQDEKGAVDAVLIYHSFSVTFEMHEEIQLKDLERNILLMMKLARFNRRTAWWLNLMHFASTRKHDTRDSDDPVFQSVSRLEANPRQILGEKGKQKEREMMCIVEDTWREELLKTILDFLGEKESTSPVQAVLTKFMRSSPKRTRPYDVYLFATNILVETLRCRPFLYHNDERFARALANFILMRLDYPPLPPILPTGDIGKLHTEILGKCTTTTEDTERSKHLGELAQLYLKTTNLYLEKIETETKGKTS